MDDITSEEGLISLGPWGGKGAVAWTYKADGPIIQITINYGQVVHSIWFESKSFDGKNVGSSLEFGNIYKDAVSKKFCIDRSVEQLSSIMLTYEENFGEVTIISLGLNTNLNKYGPFGSRSGASSLFIPIEGGVIAGFHGRNGTYHLSAVGILMAPKVESFPRTKQTVYSLQSIQDPDSMPTQSKGNITHEEGWIALGPWGGDGGVDWAYKLDGPMMQISIRYGDVIHSILFESMSGDGVVIGSSMKQGGNGGDVIGMFCIDSSKEQLLSIILTWKRYNGKRTIASLCFYTNLKKYGPYGSRAVDSVSIPIKGGIITGFHGRVGTHLNAIGIFVAPIVNSLPSSEKKFDPLHSVDEDTDSVPIQLKGRICAEEGWISLGPWGGTGGGGEWAYRPDGPIMQITIGYGDFIHSIFFESKNHDGIVIGSSVKLGGDFGIATKTFCIDNSVEQLSSISVTYGVHCKVRVVVSLCINTNLKKIGPFVSGSGASSVSIPIEGGVIAGFHGRAGLYLDSIGIFVAPKVNSLPSSEKKDDYSNADPDFARTQPKGKITDEEGLISLGPWGWEDGVYWAYKANGPIMQISISYGEAINSILFRSRSSDGLVIGNSEKFGGTGGHMTEMFWIDSSVEQLLSISLTYNDNYGQPAIMSLCFQTNLKKYGPFGTTSDDLEYDNINGRNSGASSVFIPIEGGVIAGFHGRGGTYLTAIGLFVAPKVNTLASLQENFYSLDSVQDPDYAPTQLKGKISGEEGWISLGPWGGKAGADWAYKPDGPIMQITIHYQAVIDSILFESKSCDGSIIGSSAKVGGDGDGDGWIKTFCIDSSIEQLSSISPTYEDYGGQVAITSLCFNTNLKKYGPFGSKSGASSVSIPIEGGVIAGFHGRQIGKYLTAIGIFVAPKVNRLPSSDKKFNTVQSIQDLDSAPIHLKPKIRGEDGWISLGPWGGEEGAPWAYKANGPIMQISVRYGEAIDSILFESKSSDGIVMGCSKKIGGSSGHRNETFCIDASKERLSFISMTYEVYHGEVAIISLCFNTNLNNYGPFGLRSRAPSLSIPIEGGTIAGFHGRAGKYLTAIGIFVAPRVNCLHSIQGPDSMPTQRKVIIQNAASSSATTNKDNHHGEALQLSSKMSRNDLLLVDSAFTEYVDLMKVQLNQASQKFQDLHDFQGSDRDFDELRKDIAKLKFKIPLTTNKHDHQGGALSPTSKMIRGDLLHVDTAFAKARESMYHLNEKINQAHERFNELQMLPSSERDSKELRKAIAKLNVRISLQDKSHYADSNLHHKNWNNINEAEDGMTHFFHKEPEVAQTGDFDCILKAFHDLLEPLQDCLLCFFKFPPMATIKRTPMIYLWIGQGYVSQYLQSEGYIWDVEVHAGKIFDDLIAKGFIEPIYQKNFLVPDSCRMSLYVRSSLYKEAELRGFTSNGTLDLNPKTVCGDSIRQSSCLINVGEAIINCEREIFGKLKHIRSLYLGRWQSSATHHIELADDRSLHGLNKLNSLTFLSLRGISTITELPTIISELNDLRILDLRACHNLEVIPDKIGLLKSLTHLDMSECYFLEHMPKSLAKLSNLQVLKGFLIGDFKKKKQSCTLCDLSGLQKLRKLNIYISMKDLLRLQDLMYLERFEGLKKLTILWGRCSVEARVDQVIADAFQVATLPPRLQKLDLQCFPMPSLTNWLMPDKVKDLKKLYIRGGKLRDLGEIQKCQVERLTVEILQLKYLSELELHWKELRTLFPKLIYLHQVECPKFLYFPCDERGVWMDNKAIGTRMQL